MKKLKEEEKKDQQNPDRKSENKNEIVFSFWPSFLINKTTAQPIQIFYPVLKMGHEIKMPHSILRPPDVLAA